MTKNKSKDSKPNHKKSKAMTLPLGLGVGLLASLAKPIDFALKGDFMNAIYYACMNFTGYNPYDNTFQLKRLKSGWVPLMLGGGGSIAASKVGINRKLSQHNVPLLRV